MKGEQAFTYSFSCNILQPYRETGKSWASLGLRSSLLCSNLNLELPMLCCLIKQNPTNNYEKLNPWALSSNQFQYISTFRGVRTLHTYAHVCTPSHLLASLSCTCQNFHFKNYIRILNDWVPQYLSDWSNVAMLPPHQHFIWVSNPCRCKLILRRRLLHTSLLFTLHLHPHMKRDLTASVMITR